MWDLMNTPAHVIFLVALSVFQKKSHECVNNYYFLMNSCMLTEAGIGSSLFLHYVVYYQITGTNFEF